MAGDANGMVNLPEPQKVIGLLRGIGRSIINLKCQRYPHNYHGLLKGLDLWGHLSGPSLKYFIARNWSYLELGTMAHNSAWLADARRPEFKASLDYIASWWPAWVI